MRESQGTEVKKPAPSVVQEPPPAMPDDEVEVMPKGEQKVGSKAIAKKSKGQVAKGDRDAQKALADTSDGGFKQMMNRALPSIAQVASKHLSAERLVKIALVARQKTPKLRTCTPESFLLAIMEAAEVGLEPNTPLHHAALVPFFNNKTGKNEVQFQAEWRGLVHLAAKGGGLKTARARLVYEADDCHIEEGVERSITHRPNLTVADRGEVVLAYAVAELKDGTVDWDYMTRAQLDKIRAGSKAANSGPWVDHTEQMYKKTIIKRLMNQIPLDLETATAIARDDNPGAVNDDVLGELAASASGSGDRSADLAGKIRGKK